VDLVVNLLNYTRFNNFNLTKKNQKMMDRQLCTMHLYTTWLHERERKEREREREIFSHKNKNSIRSR